MAPRGPHCSRAEAAAAGVRPARVCAQGLSWREGGRQLTSLTATTVPAEPEAAPPSVPCGSRSSEGIAVAIRGQGSPRCVARGRLVVSPPLPLTLRHSGGFPASLRRQGVAAPRRTRYASSTRLAGACVQAVCVVHAPRLCVRPRRVRASGPCASGLRACVRADCVHPAAPPAGLHAARWTQSFVHRTRDAESPWRGRPSSSAPTRSPCSPK